MAKKNERDTNTLGELKQHLKMKEPGRLYVFHGEEVFLLNHYLGQIQPVGVSSFESFSSPSYIVGIVTSGPPASFIAVQPKQLTSISILNIITNIFFIKSSSLNTFSLFIRTKTETLSLIF